MELTSLLLELGVKEGVPELLAQYRVVRAQHLAARGALPRLDRIRTALDETIEVITGKADADSGWWRGLVIKMRHHGVAPDEIFRGQSIQEWLDDAAVRSAFRNITARWLTVGSSEAADVTDLTVLATKYEQYMGEIGQRSRGAVEVVLAVLLAGMAADLKGDPAASALAVMLQSMSELFLEQLCALGAKIDREIVEKKASTIESGATGPEIAARFFENSWPKLSDRLDSNIRTAQDWVHSTSSTLNFYDEDLVSNWGKRLPQVSDNDLKIIAYDTEFLRVALNFAQALDQKEVARKGYNAQVLPTSDSFHLFLQTRGISDADNELSDERKAENRAKDEEIYSRAMRVLESCGMTDKATIGELKANPRYQSDLTAYREELRSRNDKLQQAIDRIREKVEYYNIAFKHEA